MIIYIDILRAFFLLYAGKFHMMHTCVNPITLMATKFNQNKKNKKYNDSMKIILL